MQTTVNDIANWSVADLMNINMKKTKENAHRLYCWAATSLQITLFFSGIDCVAKYKLLGITITSSFRWDEQVDSMCVKADKKLHFLRVLKCSSVAPADLLLYTIKLSLIRPAIEYACPTWQSSVTIEQLNRLEFIQKSAIRTLVGSTDYELQYVPNNVETVKPRPHKTI